MFDPIKAEVASRFAAVESFFKASRTMPKDAEKTARGLAFVHMYAAYQFTVDAAVEAAINSLIKHAHQNKNLSPSLLALFLDPELRSLKDCGRKDVWKRRVELFNRAFSDNEAFVGSEVMPSDGQHYRYSQLQMIFEVFGIKRSPVHRKSHSIRINEVVNHRNQVAHGRETADGIGKSYTRAQVLHAIRQMKSVCNLFVSIMEKYCANPKNHCKI